MTITQEIARKVIETVDAGLCRGVGNPKPGEMCVEAAVCFALGIPHGDNPPCVGSAVRQFKIALNDCAWSSDAARAKGLRKIAVAQLGSDTIDQRAFTELLALKTIQQLCPRLFRALRDETDKPDDKDAMEAAAVTCETATNLKDAALALARALALALALDLALARALARALDLDLARALALARALDLALALARALDLDLARALALDLDEAFVLLADIALECLVELKSPGCEWLPLCEVEEGTP